MIGEAQRVILVDPLQTLTEVVGDLPTANVPPNAEDVILASLDSRLYEAVLVAEDLGAAGSGADLVLTAAQHGCLLPIVLVIADGNADRTALEARGILCVERKSLDPRDLLRLVLFARLTRLSAEQRHARALTGIGSYLAHEGGNALSAVRGALQVVSDRLSADDLQRELCVRISARADAFAQSLDVLARTLDASPACNRTDVALAPLIRNEVDRLAPRPLAEVNGEGSTRGDPTQLAKLFTALLENAAEAAGKAGHIAVTISQAAGCNVIDISDSGPPVTASQVAGLLHPFSTTKSAPIGLGLPTANRIAEAHGGVLRLRQSPSGSLQVRVHLPAAP